MCPVVRYCKLTVWVRKVLRKIYGGSKQNNQYRTKQKSFDMFARPTMLSSM